MISELPIILSVLPLKSLYLHEAHDQLRTASLLEYFHKQGILRNPPIVMAIPRSKDRYIVLDGANRVTAMQEMAIPYTVVQIIDNDKTNVELTTWNHILKGISQKELIAYIKNNFDHQLLHHNKRNKKNNITSQTPVVRFIFPNEPCCLINLRGTLNDKVSSIYRVVNHYKETAAYDRTRQNSLSLLDGQQEKMTALVCFPTFDIQSVLLMVENNCLLPAGITRFMVRPRALHVNYPFSVLSDKADLSTQQDKLDAWINNCARNRSIRYYAESTVLFDE